MARRRLGPPQWGETPGAGAGGMAEEPMSAQLETKAMFAPPIARIVGQTAAEAALQTLAADLEAARAEGRLIEALPLEAIDAHHLVRDRLAVDDEEMAALETSLRERGQQVPIEVVDLAPASDGSPRYGLISGWRRLTALRRLAQAAPERFTAVLAIRRRPESSAEAYRAMVEENELRVGLSYYERARIVARAVEQQVFASPEAALAGLFGAGSRARRSKIGSFVRIHEALDGSLRFPTTIPERLGLQLARALQDDGFAARLRERLRANPAGSAEAELKLLGDAVKKASGERVRDPRAVEHAAPRPEDGRVVRPAPQAPFAAKPLPKPAMQAPGGGADPQQEVDALLAPGVRLRWREGRVLLTGPAVDGALVGVLAEFLPEYLRDRL